MAVGRRGVMSRALSLCLPGGLAPRLALAGGCSRSMRVPMSPLGPSVLVTPDGLSGVYPDLLRGMSGCRFEMTSVPRARQEAMFENGRADLLIPASSTPRRDRFGVFVPLISVRATLISVNSERRPVNSLQALLERRELRVALVRGFDYGEAYQDALKQLKSQGRLSLDADAASIARLLDSGLADVTIMAPSIFFGVLHTDARVRHLQERVRLENLEELPWIDAGAYISRSAVSEDDRAVLQELLERSVRSGALWKNFQRYYAAKGLSEGIRPKTAP